MAKSALNCLSVSYQKKDWQSPARQSFFWYDTDYNIIQINNLMTLWNQLAEVQLVSYQKKVWRAFFWYDNNKDLKVSFSMKQFRYALAVVPSTWSLHKGSINYVPSCSVCPTVGYII